MHHISKEFVKVHTFEGNLLKAVSYCFVGTIRANDRILVYLKWIFFWTLFGTIKKFKIFFFDENFKMRTVATIIYA